MDSAVKLVGEYGSRDKFIRLCQYLAKFLAGSGKTRAGARLATLSSELGACRTVLRLFDDVPMLAYTLSYGLGRQEGNGWLRWLELASNLANQLYYPLEHMAWFARKGILEISPASWELWCLVAWMVSLVAEILKCVVRLRLIGAARVKLARETELEAKSDQESAEQNATIRNKMRNLGQQSWAQYLCIVENLADLINAINWMPQGFLFGGQFSSKFTGAMGTISSLLKLYRLHASKKAS